MFSITTMQFSFTQVIKMILVSNKFMLKIPTQDIRTTLYQSHNLLLGSSQYEGRNASHEVSHKCIWKYHRCCRDCRFRRCFQQPGNMLRYIYTTLNPHNPGFKGLIVFHFLQAYEFFLFAGVMVLDMILLGWMAMGYKYVDYTTGEGVVKDDDQRCNTVALQHE